jgi:two-component system, OmpR family, copper resistance phosphate regulon response regulator CusR
VATAVGPRSTPDGLDRDHRRPSWDGAELARILVAEDEPRISSFLERGLAMNGFATDVVETGDGALELARSGRFDLLILDVGLPNMDGFEVLRELRRARVSIPVVILTARETVREDDAAHERADYIAKPFRFADLLECVRHRLLDERRSAEPTTIAVGDMMLDLRTRQAIVDGLRTDLSAREFAMAETFFRHAGEILTREQLLDLVWGYDYDRSSNIVDVYVGYLRRKLGKHRISSLRGMGYRLEKDDIAPVP